MTMNCTMADTGSAIYTAINAGNNGTPFTRWGGFLQTNGDVKYFTAGNYIEFRALFNGSNSYMWPAIWFYAAEGYNSGNMNSGEYSTAEIDLVEPQRGLYAYTTLWYDGNSSRSQNGWDPLGTIPNNTWEVYGMDWQTDTITFYHNGAQVGQVTNSTSGSGGANIPAYYASPDCKMGVRFDYTMFGGEPSGNSPEVLSMSIDYVREYPNFAASQS